MKRCPIELRKRLHELFSYDETAGVFRRKLKRGAGARGRVAGCINGEGYRVIGVDRVTYSAHRLVFVYMFGRWPLDIVDHINRNPDDNRLSNLREATRFENLRNQGAHKDNRSGYKGVSFSKSEKRWVARIMVNRKAIRLGSFKTAEDAHDAYCEAAEKFHREFARVS